MRAFSHRLECGDHRDECANRSSASLGNGTTKTLNIILCRTDEGKSGNNYQYINNLDPKGEKLLQTVS